MGLPQTINALAGGINPAALGHWTRRAGLAADLVGTVDFDFNIFRVIGGPIMITSFYGKVTTVIGAGGATLQLQHTSTETGDQEDLSGIGGAIDTDAVDTIYTITGAFAGAMAISDQVGVSDASMATNFIILDPGVMNIEVTTAETTGVIDWIMHWIPLEVDAAVVAL